MHFKCGFWRILVWLMRYDTYHKPIYIPNFKVTNNRLVIIYILKARIGLLWASVQRMYITFHSHEKTIEKQAEQLQFLSQKVFLLLCAWDLGHRPTTCSNIISPLARIDRNFLNDCVNICTLMSITLNTLLCISR